MPLTNGLPVATPPGHPFILFTAQDIGEYSSYGLEASLKGKIGSNWSWMFNYSWTEVDADIPDNRGGNIQWPFFLGRSTPEHKANAQMSYERGPWLIRAKREDGTGDASFLKAMSFSLPASRYFSRQSFPPAGVTSK